MSWEVVKPKIARFSGDTVRFSLFTDKGRPRIKISFGGEVLDAMKWKLGDMIQIVFNKETTQIGFQKSKTDSYKLSGRHKSGDIAISEPSDGMLRRVLHSLCNSGAQSPTVEKSILVLNCREFLK